MAIADIIRQYAENLSAVIDETKPTRSELRELLETELGKLLGDVASLTRCEAAKDGRSIVATTEVFEEGTSGGALTNLAVADRIDDQPSALRPCPGG